MAPTEAGPTAAHRPPRLTTSARARPVPGVEELADRERHLQLRRRRDLLAEQGLTSVDLPRLICPATATRIGWSMR
jgi:hypothetical protein